MESDKVSSLMRGDMIRHVKRDTTYEVISFPRGKVCGMWVPGVCYVGQDNEVYWRSVYDFGGFVPVSKVE